MSRFPQYDFEYLFIDNASTDETVSRLKAIAKKDDRLKIIVNNRNFGHIRSPYWGILQSAGDATIYLASDFQDPPEVIPEFIEAWEAGFKIVMAAKPVSRSNPFFHVIRKLYYRILDRISDVEIIKDSTGFGLYDHEVIEKLREVNDPYPFLRGLICEFGYPLKTVEFDQPPRRRGISKNNFYTLYDIAWLGFVSHSRVPIRVASFAGIFVGLMSLMVAFLAFLIKLIWWDAIPIGISPIVIGMFLMFGLVLVFIGVLGEYIGAILTYVQKRPIVVERERVNFKDEDV